MDTEHSAHERSPGGDLPGDRKDHFGQRTAPLRQFIGTVLSIGYDTVIVIVACGIFGAALILQIKAGLGEIE